MPDGPAHPSPPQAAAPDLDVTKCQYWNMNIYRGSAPALGTGQGNVIQCGTETYISVHYGTVQCITLQCSTLRYIPVRYSVVENSAVECSKVQSSAVHYISLSI